MGYQVKELHEFAVNRRDGVIARDRHDQKTRTLRHRRGQTSTHASQKRARMGPGSDPQTHIGSGLRSKLGRVCTCI